MAAKNMAPKHNEFIPLKIAVLTVSDSRTAADDSSGDYLVSALTEAGHQLTDRALCPDNLFRIRAQVSDWIVDDGVQVVLINGGTGFNEQNRVPEAVGQSIYDEIVAFAETEKYLDTPVKRYSSGMYVRLAFAVAAHRVRRPGEYSRPPPPSS